MSGCIPSLHPLYTEETRTIDDRIIGNWVDQEDYITNSPYAKKWDFERFTNYEYRYKDYDKYTIKVTTHEIDTALLNRLNYELHEKIEHNYYTLNHRGKKSLTSFRNESDEKMVVNLTKIKGELYADFYPWLSSDKSPYEGIAPNPAKGFFDFSVKQFHTNTIYGHTFAKIVFENNNMIIKSFDPDYFEKLIKENKIRLKHEIVEDEIIITASTEELRNFVGKYGSRDELFLEGNILQLNTPSE